MPFLFEFMDLPWIPDSLRFTVREVLEICLGEPPRHYYPWVVQEILKRAAQESLDTVVELGSGTAPLSRRLAAVIQEEKRNVIVEMTDLFPDESLYRSLEKQYPGIARANLRPFDLAAPIPSRPKTLLVLSASFHHLHPAKRKQVLGGLSGHRVMVFEPIRRHWLALVVSLFGFFPGFMAPLFYLRRRSGGHARRILWCWIIPLAPLMIVWDGLVSCLRCWTEQEWRRAFAATTKDNSKSLQIQTLPLSQMVSW